MRANNMPYLEAISTVVLGVAPNYDEIVNRVRSLKVTDQDTLMIATESVAILHRVDKALEAKRVEAVAPLNDQVKAINASFKEAIVLVAGLEAQCKAEIASYQREVEKRAREERERLEAEYRQREKERLEAEAERKKSDDGDLPPLDLEPFALTPPPDKAPGGDFPTTVRSTTGGVRFVTTWAFMINDDKAVPREYLKVDEVKIRDAVRAGVREIPGVAIYQEKSVRNV